MVLWLVSIRANCGVESGNSETNGVGCGGDHLNNVDKVLKCM